MGNAALHGHSATAGKVILSSGAVFTYEQPLTVAELMLEHPREVVVEFPTGKNTTPLPADRKLETKKVYLMVPMRKGKLAPTLSSEASRKLLAKTNSVLKSKAVLSYTGFLPLLVRICPGKKEDLAVLRKKKGSADDEAKPDYFAEALEGWPEVLSRQISGKGWRPSLDTIVEKSFNNHKVRHWMF